MKQRISIDDITGLTQAQQENLRDIWVPERYDIAVSRFCTNAEKDEYKWLEFAVGEIKVLPNNNLLLRDLRLTDGFSKINEGESLDDSNFFLQEPASFLKSEALPLLNLGQLITMLNLIKKKKYHFYLLAGNDNYGCEIGEFNSELKPYLLSKPDKDTELVDILWRTIKMIL